MNGTRAKGLILQDRDRHLLRELETVRVCDREGAEAVAGFRSVTRANTRLLALARAGYLRRFFVGTITSGRKSVYCLSEKGAAAVNVIYRGISRRQNELLIGDSFVAHQEQINRVFVQVKYKPIPDGRFLRWITFSRQITNSFGLIPDGYFEIEKDSKTVACFLEVDLGSESLTVWKTKAQNYVQMAVAGDFERRFHQPQFRILVIAHSQRRLNSIRSTVAAHTTKIFWFSTFELINREGFWSAVWLRPTGDQKCSL